MSNRIKERNKMKLKTINGMEIEPEPESKVKTPANDTEMTSRDWRIVVGIPCHGIVKPLTCVSFASLIGESVNNGLQIAIMEDQSGSITMARNNLVRRSMQMQATHLLMVDSDMVFPPFGLLQLCNSLTLLQKSGEKVAAVCATYPKRVQPYELLGETVEPLKVGDSGLKEAVFVPSGFMLFDLKAFNDIERPWFAETYQTWAVREENIDGVVGEDVYFCLRAKDAGYKVFIDLEVTKRMGHLGDIIAVWDQREITNVDETPKPE